MKGGKANKPFVRGRGDDALGCGCGCLVHEGVRALIGQRRGHGQYGALRLIAAGARGEGDGHGRTVGAGVAVRV